MTIIALLIATLLPALGAAKREAYRVSCLNNMKTQGIALNSYAADFKDAPPANVHNPIASDAGGPYRHINNAGDTASGKTSAFSNSGRGLRFDKDAAAPNYGNDNFTWTGLGLLWATQYVPYTKNGGLAFWCPGESIGRYNGVVSQWGYGPGYNWSLFMNRPWRSAGDIATSAYSGYSYRSTYGIPTSVTKNDWPRIARLPRYVATVDAVQNLYGEAAAASGNTQRVSTHDGVNGVYRGLNRLWYDGRATWKNDPNVSWRSTCPSGNTNYGNWYATTAWTGYDTP